MATPRFNEQDIEIIKAKAEYGEGDVILSANLFDELIAQYRPHRDDTRSHHRGTALGISPLDTVRRA